MSGVSKAILNQTGLICGWVRLTVICVTCGVSVFIMFPVENRVYFIMDDHQNQNIKWYVLAQK